MKTMTSFLGIILLLFTLNITNSYGQIKSERRPYPWQVQDDRGLPKGEILDQVSPQVKIVPTKFSPSDIGYKGGFKGRNGKMWGLGQSINSLLSAAYSEGNSGRYRMVFTTKAPKGHYDFIANLPEGNKEALQREIERQFNLTARTEKRKTDVLLFTVKDTNAQGLRPSANNSSDINSNWWDPGHYYCTNMSLSNFVKCLEYYFETPVVDRTDLAGRFDIDIRWKERDWQHRNPDALKKVLLDELGLELVPGREEIEMLVVEKAH